MPASGNQTEFGKAFEYACAFVVQNKCMSTDHAAIIEKSPQVYTAERFFNYLSETDRDNYLKGARAALRIIERLEPKLSNYSGNLIIRLVQLKQNAIQRTILSVFGKCRDLYHELDIVSLE